MRRRHPAAAHAAGAAVTRDRGRPEYRERRVAVVLAQGAALRFVDGTNGVKVLDVSTCAARRPMRTSDHGLDSRR